MSATLLDGRRIAAEIQAEAGERAQALRHAGHQPRLAVVLVGDHPASAVYVRGKVKACAELGIASEQVLPTADISTSGLLAIIAGLNANPAVDGILVQLPLPVQVDTRQILLAVDPDKDVDGFHPMNVGNLVAGRPGPRPCTPAGIIELLRRNRIEIAGREAVVVGRSDIVGKPMALLLLQENATVTIAHSRTRDLADVCRRAEILVAAVGQPGFLGREAIRPGAIVVDVGMNRLTDAAALERFYPGDERRRAVFSRTGSTLIGDVDPVAAAAVAGAFTPVPGGVGPLTIAMLMANTVAAAERHSQRRRPV
ncbi:MAG: bifunctional methylenetetrahydrofolate dehydrogenase/methenyltetrahydrofolate cyclohydrolase FolD [Terriglobales bacterium]